MKIEFRLSDSLGRTYDYVDGKRTAGIDNGPLAGPHAEHADKTAMVKYAAEKANLRHVVALDDFRSRGSGLRRQTASLRIEAATVRLKKAKIRLEKLKRSKPGMDVPDARDTIVADQPCLVAVNTSICDEKPSIENYLLSAAIRSHFEEWSGGFPPESEREIFVYVEYAQEEENADLVQKVLRGWMAGDEPTIQNCKTS